MDKDWYFIYGYGHDPGMGYYDIVVAPTGAEARQKFFDHYGHTRWALTYPDADAAGVKTWGLKLNRVIK